MNKDSLCARCVFLRESVVTGARYCRQRMNTRSVSPVFITAGYKQCRAFKERLEKGAQHGLD